MCVFIDIVSDPKLSSSEGPSPHPSRGLPQTCRWASERFAGLVFEPGFFYKVLWGFAKNVL